MSSVQAWDMNSEDIDDVEQKVKCLPHHFNNTMSVRLLFEDEDSYHTVSCLRQAASACKVGHLCAMSRE